MELYWNRMREAARYGYRNRSLDLISEHLGEDTEVTEMFGFPNKVAGMWLLALLTAGGTLQVFVAKDKKALINPQHQAYVDAQIKGRHMAHLPNDAKPEDVLHDLRKAFKPSKIEVDVVS